MSVTLTKDQEAVVAGVVGRIAARILELPETSLEATNCRCMLDGIGELLVAFGWDRTDVRWSMAMMGDPATLRVAVNAASARKGG